MEMRTAPSGSPVLFPYVDLMHTDSWLASHNCWTDYCLRQASTLTTYNGHTMTTHRSNGTIAYLDSGYNSQVLGLQASDAFCNAFLTKAPVSCLANATFVEGFSIYSDGLAGTGGLIGLGTIYGLQSTLEPIIYKAYQNGQIGGSIFSMYWGLPFNELFLGPPTTAFSSNEIVALGIPLAVRDGTWNFIVNNLLVGSVGTGVNGLGVMNSLDSFITVPVAVGQTIADLLNATTIIQDGYSYYNYTDVCPLSSFPNITFNVNAEIGGQIPLNMSYYVQLLQGTTCSLRIRGKDLFTETGTSYWSLGMPLLTAYYTSYNFTLGQETIGFNITSM